MIEKVLWLITARSGSTGIKDKNIKELQGLSLIAYKIKTALTISSKENVWVSTDSEKYAVIAERYGAQVPFLRPKKLASSESSSIDVVLHAMDYAHQIGKKYSFIGLLEPTSPFVYYADIGKALTKLYLNNKAEAIVAVRESRPNTIFIQEEREYLDVISERIENNKLLGRQFFKPEITPSGGFYISRWDNFIQNKSFYTKNTIAYKVPLESELEIDEPIDWLWAEFLLEKNIVDITKLWK